MLRPQELGVKEEVYFLIPVEGDSDDFLLCPADKSTAERVYREAERERITPTELISRWVIKHAEMIGLVATVTLLLSDIYDYFQ